jgi:exopolyphosphatase/pppGpp-phosphohydrolase
VEFIVGDSRRAALLESRKLGAARMTAKYIHSDPISDDDRKALLRHYQKELAPLVEQIASHKPVKVIGTERHARKHRRHVRHRSRIGKRRRPGRDHRARSAREDGR